MTHPQPLIRLAPITSGRPRANPRILLAGAHPPTLLRYLDGWPRHWGGRRAFLIEFVQEQASLAHFASDSFDLAVIPAPGAGQVQEVVRELTRVARQGLITRR